MEEKTQLREGFLTSEEAKALKARVYDLDEGAAKQALYGIIQIFTIKSRFVTGYFEELIDDAQKYSLQRKRG